MTGTLKIRELGLLLFCALGLGLLAAALTPFGIREPMLAAGIAYMLLFVSVAWNYPHVALLLIFASAPFQSDLSGGLGFAKFSLAEINMALTLPVFLAQNLIRKRPLLNGPIFVPVTLYFAVCLYSSWRNWHDNDALISLVQMFLYFFVAVTLFASFARYEEQLRLPLNGLVCIGVFLSIMSMVTAFHFLGMNKNGIGDSLACCLVVCVELWFAATGIIRKTALAVSTVIITSVLMFSLSRGAWVGAFAGLFTIVLMRRQFKLLLRGSLLLIPVIAVCWQMMPQESRDYATGFGRDRVNINARYESVDIARSYFEKSPIYGQGVGLRKEYDATNLVWATLAETGILGLAAFLLIYVALFQMIWKTQRYVARTDALYSFLAVGGALTAEKFMHGLVDHYWSRGAVTLAWTAVGMATGVYYRTQQRARQSERL